MQFVFPALLFIIGICLGSFLCCMVRRIYLKTADNEHLGNRSVCMHCRYQLKWYDNIPIFSWLFLRGKCRKCHQKIGSAEILSELGVGLSFLMLGLNFDLTNITLFSGIIFALILLLTALLSFLAIYDGLYGELPSLSLSLAIFCALATLFLREWSSTQSVGFSPELIWRPLISVMILGGVYLIFYTISKGRWVGDGDWLLGTAIAIALYDPWLSLIALFLANFIAFLIMFPIVKIRKNHRIYFGPFLVIAFVITYAFSDFFLSLL